MYFIIKLKNIYKNMIYEFQNICNRIENNVFCMWNIYQIYRYIINIFILNCINTIFYTYLKITILVTFCIFNLF